MCLLSSAGDRTEVVRFSNVDRQTGGMFNRGAVDEFNIRSAHAYAFVTTKTQSSKEVHTHVHCTQVHTRLHARAHAQAIIDVDTASRHMYAHLSTRVSLRILCPRPLVLPASLLTCQHSCMSRTYLHGMPTRRSTGKLRE